MLSFNDSCKVFFWPISASGLWLLLLQFVLDWVFEFVIDDDDDEDIDDGDTDGEEDDVWVLCIFFLVLIFFKHWN